MFVGLFVYSANAMSAEFLANIIQKDAIMTMKGIMQNDASLSNVKTLACAQSTSV